MRFEVEVNENELLKATNEMIEAAEVLNEKAWNLKNMILKEKEKDPAQ